MDEEVLANTLKSTKRADDKAVSLVLNNDMIKSFNKNMIGEGKWNRDTADKMMDKYYMSQEQHKALEAPSLKGTKLHMR